MELPPDIRSRLQSLEKLPTLPVVIENLGRALKDPEVDADQIARIIEDDPAIMARIMKVVYSVYFQGAKAPPTLKAAIVRLGFQAVSNLAMSAAVFSTFPPKNNTVFDRSAFWRHCIATGIAAECVHNELSRFAGLDLSPDVLHVCGLLHDIGKIIFEQYFHDRFVEALELSKTREMSLSAAESRVLGTDHTRVGAWLGRKWNLSEQLLEVVRWHHSPQNAAPEYQGVVSVCYLANLLVNAAGQGDSGNAYPRYARKIEHEFDLDAKNLLYLNNLIQTKMEQTPLMMALSA